MEQHVAIVGAVGVALVDQGLDHGDHLTDVFGGARLVGHRQHAQRLQIIQIVLRRTGGQVGDGNAGLQRAGDDLVIDVGDVADKGDIRDAEIVAQQAVQHVEVDRRAGIAQMRKVVDRGAAEVDADPARDHGLEGFKLPGQGVGQADVATHAASPRSRARILSRSSRGSSTAISGPRSCPVSA